MFPTKINIFSLILKYCVKLEEDANDLEINTEEQIKYAVSVFLY